MRSRLAIILIAFAWGASSAHAQVVLSGRVWLPRDPESSEMLPCTAT